MTEQELLELTIKELPAALCEILPISKCLDCRHNKADYELTQCKYVVNFHTDDQEVCEHAQGLPIPLTLDNAFKWKTWAIEKHGASDFEDGLITVKVQCCPDEYINDRYTKWLACYKTHIDDLKAAALCEIRSKT